MRINQRRWWSTSLTMMLLGSMVLSQPILADEVRPSDQKESVVTFTIGSRIYTVDDQKYEMDVAPRIDGASNRTLLPVRYVANAMNGTVHYNEEGQRITVVHNETQRVLELGVGDSTMVVTDSEDQSSEGQLDQAPVVDPPGRTMLPVRAVAEALYGKVSFNPETRQLRIVRPANQPPTLEPAPSQIDFGSILPQDHKNMERHSDYVRTIPIVNRGQGPLYVDDLNFKGGNVFSFCGRKFEPFVLDPGESRMILVCAEAREPADYEDVLIFKSRVRFEKDLLIRPIFLYLHLLGCRVAIDGGGLRPDITTTGSLPKGPAGTDRPLVNVGQQIALQANVSTIWTPVSYQWTVNGVHIKDYHELTTAAWSTNAMAPADYTNSSISFYWKQLGAQVVSVKVRNSLGFYCSASYTFSVERNSLDINRQAEDFYTWNHTSASLVEHGNWHSAHMYNPCVSVGALFQTFHHDYLGRFDSWRAEFGYAAIAAWNPATPLPGGTANAHAGRNPGYNPATHGLPTYLTAAGGVAASPCWGKHKKSDFATTNQFWIEVEGPFHNSVHGALGGDMGWTTRAPKDPIFWRFHKLVDGL